MSLPLLFGCAWVIAASIVAMLPMRFQIAPGLALLIAAPVLLWFIARDQGWWLFGIGLFAFLSMFRRPLGALLRLAAGRAGEADA